MSGFRTAGIAVAATFAAMAACSDDVTDPASINDFGATLFSVAGAETGGGTAQLDYDGAAQITYSIEFQGLSVSPTQAHIHRGGAGATIANSPVMVDLCASTGTPCPPGELVPQDTPPFDQGYHGTITGVITQANMKPGMTLDGMVNDMRGFGAFVDVHTAAAGNSELRGNVVPVY